MRLPPARAFLALSVGLRDAVRSHSGRAPRIGEAWDPEDGRGRHQHDIEDEEVYACLRAEERPRRLGYRCRQDYKDHSKHGRTLSTQCSSSRSPLLRIFSGTKMVDTPAGRMAARKNRGALAKGHEVAREVEHPGASRDEKRIGIRRRCERSGADGLHPAPTSGRARDWEPKSKLRPAAAWLLHSYWDQTL